ncbi:50S ribosomal protein L17 [Ancrocorticia populi]|uniref:50S ribosomal protein L17 n=1 Tax=Ancrocorticia populi TaxID=2175228 RepID=UPI003F91CC1A
MPKPKKGARLGGSAAHQRHIIANMCKALIEHKSVTTTEARAKLVQPHMEKLITKAKKGDTANRRQALRVLKDRESAYILFEELAPLFAEREGGYTRITKIGERRGDNAPMAVLSLVTEKVSPKQAAVSEAENAAKKAAAVAEEPASAESSASSASAASFASAVSAESADEASEEEAK